MTATGKNDVTLVSSPAVAGEGDREAVEGARRGGPPPLRSLRSLGTSPATAGEEKSRALPAIFENWFASRGWSIRPHQSALIEHAARGESVLLVAPTGGGKTLAGFLPSLIDLAKLPARRSARLHTLYISPLKALAVDVARNLEAPVAEMGLPIRVETRTGDTSVAKRQRQRHKPPDILLTTPEQLALLLSNPGAGLMFADLKAVVLDELHAMHNSKRGDLLALGLARLRTLAPAIAASAFPRPSPIPRPCSAISCRSPPKARRVRRWSSAAPAPSRRFRSARPTPTFPGPAISRATRWAT